MNLENALFNLIAAAKKVPLIYDENEILRKSIEQVYIALKEKLDAEKNNSSTISG